MFYQVHGQQNAETLLLSSGLGGSHHYWEPQLAELAKDFRVIVYDHFGTGKSPGTIPEGYGIKDMSDELLEVLAKTDTQQVHFIGHALGGLIGLQLALDFPEKVSSLLLINAWEKTDEHTKQCFEIRKSLLENSGIEMFLKAQPLFLYPAEWMKQNRTLLESETAHAIKAYKGADNLLRRINAVASFDVTGQLGAIDCPTGIVVSQDDLLVPYSCSEHLQKQIKNAQLFSMPYGGHACNITEPQAFNAILRQFYQDEQERVA